VRCILQPGLLDETSLLHDRVRYVLTFQCCCSLSNWLLAATDSNARCMRLFAGDELLRLASEIHFGRNHSVAFCEVDNLSVKLLKNNIDDAGFGCVSHNFGHESIVIGWNRAYFSWDGELFHNDAGRYMYVSLQHTNGTKFVVGMAHLRRSTKSQESRDCLQRSIGQMQADKLIFIGDYNG
jgi:hypothetical protein